MDKVIGGQDVLVIEFESCQKKRDYNVTLKIGKTNGSSISGQSCCTPAKSTKSFSIVQFLGDEEIVMHAFLRAGHYGAKSYACLDCILRSWRDAGIRTIEDVYDREIAERY